MRHVIRTLFRLASVSGSPPAGSDLELLSQFVRDRDEAAFAAIVDRHGPMVLGVARRVLRDPDAADDVFQATFLALARSASAIHRSGGLPAWLHRTAVRAAVKHARARRPDSLVIDPPAPTADPLDTLTARELLAAVDDEIRRLPAPLRSAVVTCGLEGRSQDEAARLLGWTPGQVRGRLERGRRRLQDRLARRGLALAAGGVLLLAPAPIVTAGLRDAAVLVATGRATASRVVVALAAAAVGRTVPVYTVAILLLGLAAVGLTGLIPGRLPHPTEHVSAPPIESVVEPDEVLLPDGAIRRFGTARFRIGDGPIAVTPDGASVVSVSPAGAVRVLDSATGRVTAEYLLPMPAKAFYTDSHALLSADGSTAVTSVFNADATGNTLTAWNLHSRKPLWTLTAKNGGKTDYAALSADGRRLVVVEPSADWKRSTVRGVDLGTGRTWVVVELTGPVQQMCLSQDGKRLAVVANMGGGELPSCLDIDTGAKLWTADQSGQLAGFSSNGTLLFANLGEYTRTPLILDARSGKPADGITLPNDGFRFGPPLLSSPDGRTVLEVDAPRSTLWDYRIGKKLWVIPTDREKHIAPGFFRDFDYRRRGVAFSHDGKTLFTSIDRLRRWDTATGAPLDSVDPGYGHNVPVIGVRYSTDCREVYSIGTDQLFGRWAADSRLLATGEAKGREFAGMGYMGYNNLGSVFRAGRTMMVFDRFASAAPAPDQVPRANSQFRLGLPGRTLLTVPTADGRWTLKLMDVSTEDTDALRLIRSTTAPDEQTTSVVLPWTRAVPTHPVSPCGRWIVLDGKVYSTATGSELLAPEAPGVGGRAARLATDPNRFERVWFSPDDRFLAGTLAWQDGTLPGVRMVAVWELASGRAFPAVPVHGYHDAAVSPGGRTLVDGGIQGITVRDLFAGTSLRLPRRDLTTGYDYRQSQPIGFSPSGRAFVTGHVDGSVIEWAVPHAARTDPAPAAEAAWADLVSADLRTARAMVERLVDHPDAADAILGTKFAPPEGVQPAGERSDAPEIPVSGDVLRGVRAIEVLERTGTPAARALLARWRDQTRRPRLAAEAAVALDRFGLPSER
ncbi:sigma-70 family RNA polymerase sigma factor [Fimbriiglobus ruber]|uniref:ECF RNA polymerase sigma factor SigE n=1 Tax=Fimbriiglobus ruber TaxID=1908690 RepID=A0A225DH38_9BACT|nr:sigma-70 family RNA polymerase sigma factor [Fimbriiglobus ruber]OWK37858.1 hypothetical protein FRUB_06978 [Fimbriiglobus ruber]